MIFGIGFITLGFVIRFLYPFEKLNIDMDKSNDLENEEHLYDLKPMEKIKQILRNIFSPVSGWGGTDGVLRVLREGTDDGSIGGWSPKEYGFDRMVDNLSEVLTKMGLETKCVKITYCSAAEGQKYQQTAIAFGKEIKEMGPNPINAISKEKQPESN